MGPGPAGPKDLGAERNGQRVARKSLAVTEKMQLTASSERLGLCRFHLAESRGVLQTAVALLCVWPVIAHSLNILGF